MGRVRGAPGVTREDMDLFERAPRFMPCTAIAPSSAAHTLCRNEDTHVGEVVAAIRVEILSRL